MEREERENQGAELLLGPVPSTVASCPQSPRSFLDLYSDNLPTSHSWVHSYHPGGGLPGHFTGQGLG